MGAAGIMPKTLISLRPAPRGLCPSPRRAGRGRKTTQAPHDGGPPACKDKRMLCFLTAPPDGGLPVDYTHLIAAGATAPRGRGFARGTGHLLQGELGRPARTGICRRHRRKPGATTRPPRADGVSLLKMNSGKIIQKKPRSGGGLPRLAQYSDLDEAAPHERAIGHTFEFTFPLPEPRNAGGRPTDRKKQAGKAPRRRTSSIRPRQATRKVRPPEAPP